MESVETSLGIEAALATLRVNGTTLTEAERGALDADGFVVLRDAIAPAEVAALREEFERAIAEAASAPAVEPREKREPAMQKESGTRHVDGLLSRGAPFRAVAFHPRVLAAVWHVLRRDLFLPGMAGRDPMPGFGQQSLHTDWTAPARPDRFDVVTAIALLDDYTRENGATRVVPGSHRARSAPPKEVAAAGFVHPREQLVVAPAGSILVFNGHVLHSGTRHASSGPRRTLQFTFAASEHRHRFMSTESEPDATWSAAERRLVGGTRS